MLLKIRNKNSDVSAMPPSSGEMRERFKFKFKIARACEKRVRVCARACKSHESKILVETTRHQSGKVMNVSSASLRVVFGPVRVDPLPGLSRLSCPQVDGAAQ